MLKLSINGFGMAGCVWRAPVAVPWAVGAPAPVGSWGSGTRMDPETW